MGGLRVKTEHCTAAGGLTAHRHTALNLLYTNTRVEQINTHTGKIREKVMSKQRSKYLLRGDKCFPRQTLYIPKEPAIWKNTLMM